MKTPPKKTSKPKVKLSRAAGTRGAEVISLVERTRGQQAKIDGESIEAFEAQARAEIRLPADAHVIGEPVTVTAIRNPGLPHVGSWPHANAARTPTRSPWRTWRSQRAAQPRSSCRATGPGSDFPR